MADISSAHRRFSTGPEGLTGIFLGVMAIFALFIAVRLAVPHGMDASRQDGRLVRTSPAVTSPPVPTVSTTTGPAILNPSVTSPDTRSEPASNLEPAQRTR